MSDVTKYKGRLIERTFPAGYYQAAVDNGHGGTTFPVSDTLQAAKDAIDEDIKNQRKK